MGIKVDMTVGGSAVLASLQRDGEEGGGTRRSGESSDSPQ